MASEHVHIYNPAEAENEPRCRICHEPSTDSVIALERQLAQAREELASKQHALDITSEANQSHVEYTHDLEQELAQARALLGEWLAQPQADVECEFCERIDPAHDDTCTRKLTRAFLARGEEA